MDKIDIVLFSFLGVVIVVLVVVLYLFISGTNRDHDACERGCYPAHVYHVMDDGCLCGPYIETGKPRYEMRLQDGGLP